MFRVLSYICNGFDHLFLYYYLFVASFKLCFFDLFKSFNLFNKPYNFKKFFKITQLIFNLMFSILVYDLLYIDIAIVKNAAYGLPR